MPQLRQQQLRDEEEGVSREPSKVAPERVMEAPGAPKPCPDHRGEEAVRATR